MVNARVVQETRVYTKRDRGRRPEDLHFFLSFLKFFSCTSRDGSRGVVRDGNYVIPKEKDCR